MNMEIAQGNIIVSSLFKTLLLWHSRRVSNSANIFTILVAIVHAFLFYLETFAWTQTLGQRVFSLTQGQATQTMKLAAYQGVHNFAVALALVGCLVAAQAPWSNGIRIFLLLFAIVVGLVGAKVFASKLLFIQAAPAFVALLLFAMTLAQPKINDITTSRNFAPVFYTIPTLNPLSDYDYDMSFAPIQRKYYPDIRPVVIDRDPSIVFDKAVELIEKRGWEVQIATKDNFIIEATAKTSLLGFRDDVLVSIEPVGAQRTLLHMRSRSRSGKSDFGVNADRIHAFVGDLLWAIYAVEESH